MPASWQHAMNAADTLLYRAGFCPGFKRMRFGHDLSSMLRRARRRRRRGLRFCGAPQPGKGASAVRKCARAPSAAVVSDHQRRQPAKRGGAVVRSLCRALSADGGAPPVGGGPPRLDHSAVLLDLSDFAGRCHNAEQAIHCRDPPPGCGRPPADQLAALGGDDGLNQSGARGRSPGTAHRSTRRGPASEGNRARSAGANRRARSPRARRSAARSAAGPASRNGRTTPPASSCPSPACRGV
jgi:hypothetical protein